MTESRATFTGSPPLQNSNNDNSDNCDTDANSNNTAELCTRSIHNCSGMTNIETVSKEWIAHPSPSLLDEIISHLLLPTMSPSPGSTMPTTTDNTATDSRNPIRILEIGCGTSMFARALWEYWLVLSNKDSKDQQKQRRRPIHICATDVSPVCIRHNQQRERRHYTNSTIQSVTVHYYDTTQSNNPPEKHDVNTDSENKFSLVANNASKDELSCYFSSDDGSVLEYKILNVLKTSNSHSEGSDYNGAKEHCDDENDDDDDHNNKINQKAFRKNSVDCTTKICNPYKYTWDIILDKGCLDTFLFRSKHRGSEAQHYNPIVQTVLENVWSWLTPEKEHQVIQRDNIDGCNNTRISKDGTKADKTDTAAKNLKTTTATTETFYGCYVLISPRSKLRAVRDFQGFQSIQRTCLSGDVVEKAELVQSNATKCVDKRISVACTNADLSTLHSNDDKVTGLAKRRPKSKRSTVYLYICQVNTTYRKGLFPAFANDYRHVPHNDDVTCPHCGITFGSFRKGKPLDKCDGGLGDVYWAREWKNHCIHCKAPHASMYKGPSLNDAKLTANFRASIT